MNAIARFSVGATILGIMILIAFVVNNLFDETKALGFALVLGFISISYILGAIIEEWLE